MSHPRLESHATLVALLLWLATGHSAAAPPNQPVSFSNDIRPILVAKCTACHGGVKQAGGLSFVYPDQVLPPNGWVVAPGAPDESALIQRIATGDPDLRMPPPDHGRPLSKKEINLVRRWVQQGAKWQGHWAFEKPVAPAVPKVLNNQWPRTGIDRFILEAQETAGVSPSPDAEPRQWLRRVTLDLTGLPPTLEQVQEFLESHEQDPEASYGKVVDRLLASSRFGERWASVWLDVVRYADSRGLGLDSPRNIWAYRDWVIRALNADMPYDQFTIKQLAGDLLPGADPENLIATACHRLTACNEEGGTDDEEFRVEAVLDRVNTTWQAWQGTTFGCTQCHNHPYDPFRHEDYYRFVAFFNTSLDSDLSNDFPLYQAPTHQRNFRRAAALDERINALKDSLWRSEFALLSDKETWTPVTGLGASTSSSTGVEVQRVGDHDEFYTTGTVARNTDVLLNAPLPESLDKLTALRVSILPHNPKKALSHSEWGFVLSHIEAALHDVEGKKLQDIRFAHVVGDSPSSYYAANDSLAKEKKSGYGAYSRINHPRACALVLEKPLAIPPGAELRVRLKHREFIVAAFSLVSRRGHLAVSNDHRFTELLSDPKYKSQRSELAGLTEERRQIKSTRTPIMREQSAHLRRPSYVFVRGSFLDKGEQVSPGVPASMRRIPTDATVDRLAMARWIASKENPLTARVAVNRFWARLFGAGLVMTEEDFGSSGDPPSHPKLLDYLARRFMDDFNWRPKAVLREMVLSRTYRQSGRRRADLDQSDPQNQLLARGPRFRLTSEMVRDQALAISGLLSDEMYGPSVFPPIPQGVWKPFKARDKWNVPKRGNKDRYRRSIYTHVKRSIPYPLQATFDAPSREFCTPRRLRSNTPLQALMTLNDKQFVEFSEALAERISKAGQTPEEQIAFGFELTTSRRPAPEELSSLLKLYGRYDNPQKARTAVASVLLNLDEILVK